MQTSKYSNKSLEKVLDIISQNFCITNSEIAEIMDVSYHYAYTITTDLLKAGIISRGEYTYQRSSYGQGTKKGFIYE